MSWVDPKHSLFPLKGPLLNDPNTFFILLFLINSALFSLRGLDFGTCVCRSLGSGARLTGFAKISLSLYPSMYPYMYLSIYLSVPTSRKKCSVRVDAARSIHSTEDMVQV